MRCARRVYACRNCAEPTPACKIGCSTATGDRGLCCIADPQVSVPRDAASPLLKERMVESRSEKSRQRPRRYNRRLLQQYRHWADEPTCPHSRRVLEGKLTYCLEALFLVSSPSTARIPTSGPLTDLYRFASLGDRMRFDQLKRRQLLLMGGAFGARIIDDAGDSILAEFSSVGHAVKCVVNIQSRRGRSEHAR